jgi:Uma2 family endonuclease
MTQATRKLSFEDYLQLDAADWVALGLPEGRCEYTDGELVELPSESELNDAIANYLFFTLVSLGIPLALVRPGRCEIQVPGKPRTRYPDLVVLQEEHLSLTRRRLLIRLDMPPPQLVVEVISPNTKNRNRDLIDKRQQYATRGIPEYWLIDPETHCITILVLDDGQYIIHGVYRDSDRLISPTFPDFHQTANQILNAGRS